MRRSILHLLGFVYFCVYFCALGTGSGDGSAAIFASEPALAEQLRALEADVLGADGASDEEQREQLRKMIAVDARQRLRQANRDDLETWRTVRSRRRWETLRDERITKLERWLGRYPDPPDDLRMRTTRIDKRDGYQVENVVFESRPGLLVTAHLYRPADPGESMPGILISHSHHRPKEQGELQDMGANWARMGCVLLIPDHVGHGERRQHDFASADDYPGEFRVSRQDYYFRSNVGMQLHLIGDSLMGWMVWDLRRCIDLLEQQPGVDRDQIILLGAVAGGGDPGAVTAALDPRVCCAVPFNFGGPQPRHYPLPEDAEASFLYSDSGSWESTRNLRLSARDGFLHYVIVGAIAPRRLIYAHEFSFNRERDPVWERLQTIWRDFYGVRDNLTVAHGYGFITVRTEPASHCTNIGAVHRKMIHPAFERWFGIETPEPEIRDRREMEQTRCLAGTRGRDIRMTRVFELADRLAEKRIGNVRRQLKERPTAEQRDRLRDAWSERLGDVRPYHPKVSGVRSGIQGGMRVERFIIRGEREIAIPVVLLSPSVEQRAKRPAVVMFAQSGKAALLRERSAEIAALLDTGLAVCLPDLRGTGETSLGDDRGRQSWATSVSATELMLGQTLVGSRLKDLRTVLRLLRGREDVDGMRIALWGDSLAAMNAADDRVDVPLGIGDQPHQSEPLGHLLALFGALFEDDIVAVVSARGGLSGFREALQSPYCHFPHDAVLPAAITAGDLADVAAALAPRPLWIAGLVDGQNRRLSPTATSAVYRPAMQAYAAASVEDAFTLRQQAEPGVNVARWLAAQLAK